MCINQFIARSEKFDEKHFEMLKVGPRNSYSSFDLRDLDRNAHKTQAYKTIHLSVAFDNTLPIVYKHFVFYVGRCFLGSHYITWYEVHCLLRNYKAITWSMFRNRRSYYVVLGVATEMLWKQARFLIRSFHK